MNFEQLQKIINGDTIKVGDKNNRISCQNGYFIVEFFEFTSDIEGEMFSIGDDFINIEDAINVAINYTSESYTHKKWGK